RKNEKNLNNTVSDSPEPPSRSFLSQPDSTTNLCFPRILLPLSEALIAEDHPQPPTLSPLSNLFLSFSSLSPTTSSSPFPALASPAAEADGTASGPSAGGGRCLLASHGLCLAPGLDLSLPCAPRRR
ncbi:hypothetical protein S83_048253, partial [Arachis hypogaea]